MTEGAPVYDYGSDVAGPATGDLATLTNLARQQREAEEEVARAEEVLRQKQNVLRDLSERTIPTLMKQLGMKEFSLQDGTKVRVKEQLRVSVPKTRYAEAMAWVEANGGSDLIKRAFHITFSRDEESWARKFQRDLAQRKKPVACQRTDKVEPATLTAWLTGLMKDGKDVPLETFGAHQQERSIIELPKT